MTKLTRYRSLLISPHGIPRLTSRVRDGAGPRTSPACFGKGCPQGNKGRLAPTSSQLYPRFFRRGGFPAVGDGWRDLLPHGLALHACADGRTSEMDIGVVQIEEQAEHSASIRKIGLGPCLRKHPGELRTELGYPSPTTGQPARSVD